MRAVSEIIPVPRITSNWDEVGNIPVERARSDVAKTAQEHISKHVFLVLTQLVIKVHRNLDEYSVSMFYKAARP
jgi:hypothetical protein